VQQVALGLQRQTLQAVLSQHQQIRTSANNAQQLRRLEVLMVLQVAHFGHHSFRLVAAAVHRLTLRLVATAAMVA
jgi:hypothetical protein